MTKDIPSMGIDIYTPRDVKRRIWWGCAAVLVLFLAMVALI